MAIKPNEGDIFLREVDEELRKERLNHFMARYGWLVIGAVILVVAAIGGWIWWQERHKQLGAEEGEALIRAMDSLEAGNTKAAEDEIGALAESRRDGYRLAALFTRANAQLQANDRAGAVATLGTIASDQKIAPAYRDAALVRQTALEYDKLQPQIVIQRLNGLAQPSQPWFGSAGEMVAIAYLKLGQPQRAGPLFQRIGRDETVPPTLRTRAIQMAGSLGFNALEEPASPGAAQGPAESAGPATKEKAE